MFFRWLFEKKTINTPGCEDEYNPNPVPTHKLPSIQPVEPITDFHAKNLRLQEAVAGVMPLFKVCGMRADSWDEYWHTVYHRDQDTNEISRRFVGRHSIEEKQRDSAKRAYVWIQKELQKPNCRIADRAAADKNIEELSDALRFAGFELTERDTWVQRK